LLAFPASDFIANKTLLTAAFLHRKKNFIQNRKMLFWGLYSLKYAFFWEYVPGNQFRNCLIFPTPAESEAFPHWGKRERGSNKIKGYIFGCYNYKIIDRLMAAYY
jgi:hypothetical protein